VSAAVLRLGRSVRRAPMFRDRTNVLASLALGLGLAWLVARLLSWAGLHAIWTLPPGAGSEPCRVARDGACWAVVHERFRFILMGGYPYGQHWRPALACVLFLGLYAASACRACWRWWLPFVWVAVPAAVVLLLRGGFWGLPGVPSESWGGLPLTFLLATVGFGAAIPFAVLLALGRRSGMPAIRALSVAYIELLRGVPLVTFLFMASLMFPLFLPQGFAIDKLLRAQLAIVMVIAATLAEVVRAGLQGIPAGQYEAAASIGLRFWPATLLVILPQAFRITIPALVNVFIAFFKDTSLVAIIGLFDLLGAAKAVIIDPRWVGFGVEVYVFVAGVYFAFLFAVSRYSLWLEKSLGPSRVA